MPKATFANVMTTGEQLLVSIEANKTDLAHLEEQRSELSKAIEGAKAASVQQDAFRAQFQQSTRDMEKFMSDVRELTTRLRNGVRTKYGLRSEKLAEFGMQPRRAPAKSRAKEKPAPVPQPAPASKTNTESNP
jgi:predicted RNA-binding Zn ribbon-like protein